MKQFVVMFESDDVNDVDVMDAISAIHCRSRVMDNNAKWVKKNIKITRGECTVLMCSRCNVLKYDLMRDDYCRFCGAHMEE